MRVLPWIEPAAALIALRAAQLSGLVCLESAGPLTPESRYAFCSVAPTQWIREAPERPDGDDFFPAWLGGLTYEEEHTWGWYPSGLVWDRQQRTLALVGEPHVEWQTLLAANSVPPEFAVGPWSADDVDYPAGVREIQDLIRAGEVYQVNLSRGVSAHATGDPLGAYLRLSTLNPSPFMAFCDLVEANAGIVVSCSPERLVLWTDDEVSARPIAGTRRRGDDNAEDAHFEDELRASAKERAEHIMLVDLVRHDIGRLAQAGTVEVPEFMVVERYSHVMHLVSKVSARPLPQLTPAAVLAATFPGGTITGAPKDRVREAIQALEPSPRGWYTGGVGIVSGARMDINILIRTADVRPDTQGYTVVVRAGGGTVIDADPALEAKETVHKAQALLSGLSGHPGRPAHPCLPPSPGKAWAPVPVSARLDPRRIVVVDNRDSFTFNIVHDLRALGADVRVVSARESTRWLDDAPDGVLVGPGPGTPATAGASREIIVTCGERRIPMLGVCLGHQALGELLGGRLVRTPPVHGRACKVRHTGHAMFAGIDQGATFGRYHSLLIEDVGDEFVTGRTDDGLIMAIARETAWGVQFHPESLLSPAGRRLFDNWLGTCA